MKLKEKLKICLVLITLISFAASSFAQNRPDHNSGRYAKVKEGETAPFDSWCFDEKAAAIILANKKMQEEMCTLRLNSEIAVLRSKHQYELGSIELRLESLSKEYETMMLTKDEELKKLESAALKRPNSYWYLWFGGGVVATVLVYYVGSGIGNAIALSTLN